MSISWGRFLDLCSLQGNTHLLQGPEFPLGHLLQDPAGKGLIIGLLGNGGGIGPLGGLQAIA